MRIAPRSRHKFKQRCAAYCCCVAVAFVVVTSTTKLEQNGPPRIKCDSRMDKRISCAATCDRWQFTMCCDGDSLHKTQTTNNTTQHNHNINDKQRQTTTNYNKQHQTATNNNKQQQQTATTADNQNATPKHN